MDIRVIEVTKLNSGFKCPTSATGLYSPHLLDGGWIIAGKHRTFLPFSSSPYLVSGSDKCRTYQLNVNAAKTL